MTELDEAIMALEKKWLAQAEDCEAQANRLGDQPVGREIMRDAAQYRQSAHQLAALLTTRQEVAPVADGAALLVRDVCEMAPADPDAPDTVCIRVADLTRIAELYTTTGQTSEARDSNG